MTDSGYYMKLYKESPRQFMKKMELVFKNNNDFRCEIEYDFNRWKNYDILNILFNKLPDFLSSRKIDKTYLSLLSLPNKIRYLYFQFYSESPSDLKPTIPELLKMVDFFNNRIISIYNFTYQKKYVLEKNTIKLSPKVREAYKNYISALIRGENQSDRIEFYRFIISCYRYRSHLNEVE